jgi:hypothetical protein
MVAEKFIQNVKALTDRCALTEEDLKLVMVCIQEAATISPVELMSLLDNIDTLIDEGVREFSKEEINTLRIELLGTEELSEEESI